MSQRKLMENPHEDDHSDDEKEDHHHDAHSSHAHKHGAVQLADGSHFRFNIFNHYPVHGGLYHTHTVPIRDIHGQVNKNTFYHDGAEHKDVAKEHPHAWIYNDKREMRFPCKDVKPLEVAGEDHDHSPKGKSAAPSPLAPPAPSAPPAPFSPDHHSAAADLPPPYEAHFPPSSGHGSTMFGESKAARVVRAKELEERLMHAARPDEAAPEDPCCCVIL